MKVKEITVKKEKKEPYFTEDTQNAILLYNQMDDEIKRNKIYETKIKNSFDKMVEILIHYKKFYHFDVPYEDVHHEVVAHLNEKIHKYTDPSKGKAFSYFYRCALNYLIINNNANYGKFKRTDQPEVIDETRNVINEVLRDSYREEKKEFMDLFVEYMDVNLNKFFKKSSDLQVADSVLELFRGRENVENFNKKALYILIRERTGVKTQYITKVVNTFKSIYAELYQNYKINGVAKLNSDYTKKSEFLD